MSLPTHFRSRAAASPIAAMDPPTHAGPPVTIPPLNRAKHCSIFPSYEATSPVTAQFPVASIFENWSDSLDLAFATHDPSTGMPTSAAFVKHWVSAETDRATAWIF